VRIRTREEIKWCRKGSHYIIFSERFESPRVTSKLEKAMGWCTAQCKMLLFCAKIIVKESRKFELARLKE